MKEEQEEVTYAVAEAARKLNKNYMTIWSWIRKGKLKTRKVLCRHEISASDLQQALNK